jgi:hypothetical protein
MTTTYAVLIKLPQWTILRKEADAATADDIIQRLGKHPIAPKGTPWGIAEQLPDGKYRILMSGSK